MALPDERLLTQSSTLPPAQPSYVLRGHSAQIHAVRFLRQNLRLLTGDADGWVVLWSLPIRRPIAVWKAHNATILGLSSWDDDKILTHGRDNKLQIWQLRSEDEATFSTTLPIENSPESEQAKKPWLLHSLMVSTLNFCSFAMCPIPPTQSRQSSDDSMIVATSGVQDGTISLTLLPSESRHSTTPPPKDVKTGMLMAVGLHIPHSTSDDNPTSDSKAPRNLTVAAGYESGHVSLWRLNSSSRWETLFTHKGHSQPVLSLSIAPGSDYWFTCSADAAIARYPLHPTGDGTTPAEKTIQTKHAGQQGLQVRSDEKIFATAGWDGRMRVYGVKTMRELAVLKWHKEGCYALAFAEILDGSTHADGEKESAVAESATKTRSLTVAEQRTERTKAAHWLAAGSKDGKVSLWKIY